MAADAFTPRTSKQRLPTPLNGTLFTTTRIVAQEKPLPVIGGTMEAELGPAWADSIVIGVSEPPENAKGVLTITHVRIPTEAEQLASNWEETSVSIGGKSYPAVVRSVVMLASAYSEASPAIGSALPVIATGLFDGSGFMLFERECAKSGIELEPTFRVDRRTYVTTAAQFRGTEPDQRTGVTRVNTQSLVPAASIATDTVDANGQITVYEQIDINWAIKSDSYVSSTLTKTWTDVINYEWPPILLGIVYKIWNRKDGGSDIFPVVRMKQGFSGPQLATVNQWWQATEPSVTSPQQMIPEGFQYHCPRFSLNVPPCLHTAQTITVVAGTADPVYEYTTDTETFPATNVTTWPASITWTESKPYMGGYIVTAYTVNRPV
ncbi:MAG: hypothetical protein RLZZ214_1348 [Verrucomicrobiota bacterium]|jgi:hypothetical protein